jgi:hypothetical protein
MTCGYCMLTGRDKSESLEFFGMMVARDEAGDAFPVTFCLDVAV